jgi:hypothetical protein
LARPLAHVVPWRRDATPVHRILRLRGGVATAGIVAVAAAGALLAYEIWRRSRRTRHRAELAPAVSRWEGEGGQVVDEYSAS